MTHQPRLIETAVPARPEAAVLVLHGGGSRRRMMAVSPAQLSVVRMIPIAARVARAGDGRLAVFRLLNTVRGWDTHHTPVHDVRWALGRLAERFGTPLPVGLVGHSLGGRAALLAGDRPEVRSVVALAPWVYPSDARGALADRDVLIVHGTQDRVASLQRSTEVARHLSPRARLGYVRVDGARHAMLRHHALFDGLAATFAATTLLGTPPPDDGPLARIRAGERWVDA